MIPVKDYPYEFTMNVLTSTSIETITHLVIRQSYVFNTSYVYGDLIYFIPISFLFEILFDLFHYIRHRTLHNPYLYKYAHKKHHKFPNPTSIITYYQDPLDLLMTNSLPLMLTLAIFPRISYFQFSLIIIYKNYGEICGHVGKNVNLQVRFVNLYGCRKC